jgi:hypothetical protein
MVDSLHSALFLEGLAPRLPEGELGPYAALDNHPASRADFSGRGRGKMLQLGIPHTERCVCIVTGLGLLARKIVGFEPLFPV